jgi:hypothetical protein
MSKSQPSGAPRGGSEYIAVPLLTLPTLTPIPTHLFIEFKNPKTGAKDMTLWRHAGHTFTDEELQRLLKTGAREAWLHPGDIPSFKKWWLETGKRILEERKNSASAPQTGTPTPVSELGKSPFGTIKDASEQNSWTTETSSPEGGSFSDDSLDLSIVNAVAKLFESPKTGSNSEKNSPTTDIPKSQADFQNLARTFQQSKLPLAPAQTKNQARDWSHLWSALLSESGRTNLPRDLRLKLTQESAESLLQFSLSALTPEHQGVAEGLIVDSMTHFIYESLRDVAPGLHELWNRLIHLYPTAHSLRVGSWAALLALLNGKLHRPLLADLLLAGVFHDIGLSTLNASTLITPMRHHSPSDAQDYAKHVECSVQFLEKSVPSSLGPVAKRAAKIIHQHHEKFDGRGYPDKIRGFHIDEASQFLCMADLLLSMSEGRWDGISRTHRESLAMLEKFESAGNFPEYFHPSLFQKLHQLNTKMNTKEGKVA